jgi:predicted DNA-binding transcriptional regulator YafY
MKWESHISETVDIIYQDKAGNLSQRRIRVIAVNERYVRAFCYKRKQARIFHVDSILGTGKARRVS